MIRKSSARVCDKSAELRRTKEPMKPRMKVASAPPSIGLSRPLKLSRLSNARLFELLDP